MTVSLFITILLSLIFLASCSQHPLPSRSKSSRPLINNKNKRPQYTNKKSKYDPSQSPDFLETKKHEHRNERKQKRIIKRLPHNNNKNNNKKGNITSNNNETTRSEEYKILFKKYFSNATRADAVPAAIDYLLQQKQKGFLLIQSKENIKNNILLSPNYHFDIQKGKELPFCSVTYDSIIDDSTYDFLGMNTKPPYDYNTCPFVYPTYYVPPRCQKEEEDKHIVAMYKWKWQLKAAQEGKCRMPPTTPLEAAAVYLKQKEMKYNKAEMKTRPILSTARFNKDKPGKVVNILWLGLSFLGQQFLSSLCQNYGKRGNGPNLDIIEANLKDVHGLTHSHTFKQATEVDPGGKCVPRNREDLKPGLQRAHEETGEPYNFPSVHCTPNFVEYSKIIDNEKITVRYCYSYVYNLKKNQRRLYKKLPCNFEWEDVDVIFGILGFDEFSQYYIAGSGGLPKNLKHVTYVSVQPLINHVAPSLNSLYMAHNFSLLQQPHVNGKPKSCLDNEVGEL